MLSNINKKEAVELLTQSLKAVGYPPPGPLRENLVAWNRNGVSVSILGSGAVAFHQLVNDIEKRGRIDNRPVGKSLSRKYLETKVQDLIGNLVIRASAAGQTASDLGESVVGESFDQWLREFEVPSETVTFYTVVGNLVLRRPIRLGTIKLAPLTRRLQKAILRQCYDIIGGSKASEGVKKRIREQYATVLAVNKKHALASSEISNAEPLCAEETFRQRLGEIIHALQFFGYFLYSKGLRAFVGVAGEVHSGRRNIVRLVPDREVNLSQEGTGSLVPYELTGAHRRHLNRIGFRLVGKILAKKEEERTEVENRCMNAITWISRGLQDDVPDSRFLSLCIAMESSLVRQGEDPYSRTMAERVAFLLGRRAKVRTRIFKDLKAIYGVRSRIAHEGRSAELKDWLAKAEKYAIHTVLRFVILVHRHGWKSADEFINWLDNRKFA